MRIIGVAALVGVLLSGCIEVGPFDALTCYDSPFGEYRLCYLAPPWEIVEHDGSSVQLRVPLTYSSVAPADAPPLYVLNASVAAGSAHDTATQAESDAVSGGAEIVAAVRVTATRSGDVGQDVSWRDSGTDQSFRLVAFDDTGQEGQVVLFLLETSNNPTELEVNEMVRAISIRPGGR